MKQLYKKHKQLIPLVILSLFSVWMLIAFCINRAGSGEEVLVIGNQHYYAFIAVALGYASYFFFRKAYKYILIAMIVLGLFNVLNFTVAETTWTFSLNSFHLTVQPVSFFAGLVALLINFNRLGDFLSVSENNKTN